LSAIRFLLDEHLATALAEALRLKGVDAVTVSEAHRRGESDASHLAWARVERRVIVTHDPDFLALQNTPFHAGIAYCRQYKYSLGPFVTRLVDLVAMFSAEEMVGRVEYL
jgi:hypothetical protein